MASNETTEQRLWLWRNGDHFLAYEHLYPVDENGDPLTLGEPIGYALLRPSFGAALFRAGDGEALEIKGGQL